VDAAWTKAPDEARMRSVALGFCAGRAAIGSLAVLAPGLGSRILGFPAAHDNASARVAGRLFGIREVTLAGYTAVQVQRTPQQRDLYLANAAVDSADFAVLTLTFLGRRGIARAAFTSALLAAPFAAAWLWLRGSCQD
jgi:hypothetical protein